MNKILAKTLVVSLLLSTAFKVAAQEGQDLQTVTYSTASPLSITIPSGKVMETLSGSFSFYINGDASESFNADVFPMYVAGPQVLNSRWGGWITYRLKDNISTTTTTPTSAVVIPTDATGPVNVILESSTDLVTWTQANPGTYGASTTKRFFRVRAVNQ
jgi:hypothetical protein